MKEKKPCKACGHDRFRTVSKKDGVFQCRRCLAHVTDKK